MYENNQIRVGASCLELSIDYEKNEIKLGWNKAKEIPLVKCVCKIPLCATLGGKVWEVQMGVA